MSEPVTATAESPIYVEGSDGPILVFLTSAPDAVGDVAVFSGGWHGGSFNANRVIVRMARGLAARRRNVVRFDWFGAGESPGHIEFFRLDEPSTEDGLAAVEIARQRADLPVSLVGVCVGARAALAAASQIDMLEAVALVSFPLPAARNKEKRVERIGTVQAIGQGLRPAMMKGWFQPATRRVYIRFLRIKWQSLAKKFQPPGRPVQDLETSRREAAEVHDLDVLVEQLAQLFARQVRVLFLFGVEDVAYGHFGNALDGPLGPLLERNAELVVVRTVGGDLSGFSSLGAQQSVIDVVTEWVAPSI